MTLSLPRLHSTIADPLTSFVTAVLEVGLLQRLPGELTGQHSTLPKLTLRALAGETYRLLTAFAPATASEAEISCTPCIICNVTVHGKVSRVALCGSDAIQALQVIESSWLPTPEHLQVLSPLLECPSFVCLFAFLRTGAAFFHAHGGIQKPSWPSTSRGDK